MSVRHTSFGKYMIKKGKGYPFYEPGISELIVWEDYNTHFVIFKWAKSALSPFMYLLTTIAFRVIYLAMPTIAILIRAGG